jgi:hypothetical protein
MHPWSSFTMQGHPLECPCPFSTGPCFLGDNSGPWTMEWQPFSSYSGDWLVYALQKLEKLTIQWNKWTVFYVSYFCQRISRNCPHQLDPRWKVFISSFLPLLDRMYSYYFLLLIWSPFMVLGPSSCDPCIHITWSGQGVTWTRLTILTSPAKDKCGGPASIRKPPILLACQKASILVSTHRTP